MNSKSTFFLSIVGASLMLAPVVVADDHGGGGSGGSGSGGSGSGSGSGGSSGGGGTTTSTATMVRDAQRALVSATDSAERVVKLEKDYRVRILFAMRLDGALPADVAAAKASAIASITAATNAGIDQVNTLKASLLAGLPSTATLAQRAAVTATANAGIARLNNRLRSATQDLNRAAVGNVPPGTIPLREHAVPEHFPGHP